MQRLTVVILIMKFTFWSKVSFCLVFYRRRLLRPPSSLFLPQTECLPCGHSCLCHPLAGKSCIPHSPYIPAPLGVFPWCWESLLTSLGGAAVRDTVEYTAPSGPGAVITCPGLRAQVFCHLAISSDLGISRRWTTLSQRSFIEHSLYASPSWQRRTGCWVECADSRVRRLCSDSGFHAY